MIFRKKGASVKARLLALIAAGKQREAARGGTNNETSVKRPVSRGGSDRKSLEKEEGVSS